MPEPSDAELWRSVETTVRTVLLPSLSDDWARVAAVQLVGLARLAVTRPLDPTEARAAELAAALESLREHPIVQRHWTGSSREPAVVLDAVSRVLGDCVAPGDAERGAVRAVLRPIVSRHLDEDLAVTAPLMPYFRGQLPDA